MLPTTFRTCPCSRIKAPGCRRATRVRSKLAALRRLARCAAEATGQDRRTLAHHVAEQYSRQEAPAEQAVEEASGGAAESDLIYPFEPLLDADYVLDADNYLEDYMKAEDVSRDASLSRATGIKRHAAMTGAPRSQHLDTTTPRATPRSSPAKAANLASCRTRPDPRLERRLQHLLRAKPAPTGTPCLFGVTPLDEGSHCVDDNGRYGSFGWCYTKSDRTQWGSCDESCPLDGSVDIISDRIDNLTNIVRELIAKLESQNCVKRTGR